MLKQHGFPAAAAMVLVLAAIVTFSACGSEEEPAPEPTPEPEATPEMVENVEELEAEIRRVKEEEGEEAACKAVEEAEEMIFMATEVAWLHRNPGEDLRPAYEKALAEGTPMNEVFDFDSGERVLPLRYEEWNEYDRKIVELKEQMETTVSGEHRARSLEAICEISQTNPYGYALVSDTLEELSGEMSCGDYDG